MQPGANARPKSAGRVRAADMGPCLYSDKGLSINRSFG
jgi:hypothetical protein